MRAAVVHSPGGPSVLKLERVPIPTPATSQVLIKVKAFGLNRSELFTRKPSFLLSLESETTELKGTEQHPGQGFSPVTAVVFPRILGIEATGIVESAPGSSDLKKGDIVATAMGGMGRDFDGGYAEYTVVPATQVKKIEVEIPWETLGAMPEAFQTAHGSLFKSLQLRSSDKLLVRGGTTSVGLAAAALAKDFGCFVTATTRSPANADILTASGVDEVIIDNGELSKAHRARFDKVLELVGPATLADSLQSTRVGGIVCQTGIVAGKWTIENFNPMGVIPTGVLLTSYVGSAEAFMELPLSELARKVKEGKLKVPVGKVFKLDQIVEAHECMESNKAGGKIVCLV
ncbi:zinc-binding oxidoreductase [Pseudohyphozyma bogoriensis]|nr:zinc-binding oxidoreductase [Pseudohyphozyma bogoriensis]